MDKAFQSEVVFLKVRASSFERGSYPLEVGYAGCDLAARSFIVRPDASWTDNKGSPAIAGERHPEPLEAPERGFEPVYVAGMLNEALADKRVYSAMSEWDGYWLGRLHQAAGVKQGYLVGDWYDLFERLPRAGQFDPGVVDETCERAEGVVLSGFKAASGARFLACSWLCAMDPKVVGVLSEKFGGQGMSR